MWRTSLVADADVAVGRLLTRYLPPEGFRVKLAQSGRAVLKEIVKHSPDATAMGSDLSDMTALDLVRSLRSTPAPPPVVLLESNKGVVEMLDAEATDCMRKADRRSRSGSTPAQSGPAKCKNQGYPR